MADDHTDGGVRVLLNQGGGRFAQAQGYAVGERCYAVVAGDFDGDGVTDLATLNRDNLHDVLATFRGQGDGSFAPGVTYPVRPEWGDVSGAPSFLEARDFDGNGALDLLAMPNHGEAALFLNPGNGVFGAARPLEIATFRIPTVGDVNGDGRPDSGVRPRN